MSLKVTDAGHTINMLQLNEDTGTYRLVTPHAGLHDDFSSLKALGVPAEQREHEEEPDDIGNGHVPSLAQPTAHDRASGISPATATPADDPNQIIEPPKPTA